MTSSLTNAVVLVTGAGGGLGHEFVTQSLRRGAAKVYATARTPRTYDDPRIVALVLDVTDEASVRAAAAAAQDVTVVINNAGISAPSPIATGDSTTLRAIFETNFFGAVAVAQAFAPVLARNGGGALLNVHSVLSWIGLAGAYSASKAAFWSATNSLRVELAGQGTQVLGLHFGYTDTAMTKDVTAPKNDPADIVGLALDGLEAGELEVLGDELTVDVRSKLSRPLAELYPGLAA